MKKNVFKGLLAFIIVAFSCSSSSAQCTGNKVLVCTQQGRAEPTWVCKCVPKSQVKSYVQNGWTLSNSSGAAKKDPTVTDKNLQANAVSNFLPATNKIVSSKKKI